MKLTIDYSYRGKKYDSLEGAFNDAIRDGIEEVVRGTLKPFEDDIAAEGGKVTVNVDDDYKSSFQITGISEELKTKIEKALGES